MVEISIEPLSDRLAFLAMWEQLYARAEDPAFFQSPSWIKAWLEGAPENASLQLVSARDNEQVIMLGAFSLTPRKPAFLGLRESWFQEFGEPQRDAIYAEYLDFLAAPEVSHSIKRDAVCAIIRKHEKIDGLVFRNLTDEMRSAVLSAAAACEMSVRVLNEQPVYSCDLTGESHLEGLSKSLRSKIRRAMRLYEERGDLSVKLAANGEEKAAAWERLKVLHRAGWEARGQKSVFDNPYLTAFHDRLQANAGDSVHLFEVSAGDAVIGVLYNFAHGKHVMNYQSGFKFEEDNRLTPGFVVHALAAQYYQSKGFEVYDLLAGEAEYKARLAEPHAILTSIVIERPTWRNKLRSLLKN